MALEKRTRLNSKIIYITLLLGLLGRISATSSTNRMKKVKPETGVLSINIQEEVVKF